VLIIPAARHEIEEQEARKPLSDAARYRETFKRPTYQAAQEGPPLPDFSASGKSSANTSSDSPQHLPRGTLMSRREESNVRSQRPIPIRPESRSQYQRSYNSSTANRAGGFSFSNPESIFSEFVQGQAGMGGGDSFEDLFGGGGIPRARQNSGRPRPAYTSEARESPYA
jgi:hypothetical protein